MIYIYIYIYVYVALYIHVYGIYVTLRFKMLPHFNIG